MKLKKGKQGGKQLGTLDPLLDYQPSGPFKGRSQSVVQGADQATSYGGEPNMSTMNEESNTKEKRQNREFKRVTPSLKDLDIRKLIGKYPVNQEKEAHKYSESAKNATDDIIREVNKELFSGNTRRYSNFVDMGMLYEDYTINQNQRTADILKEVAVSDTKTLKKAYNFRLVDMLEH